MKPMWSTLVCLLLIVPLSGCLGEDPSSFRSVDQLLAGRWTFQTDEPGRPTVDFNPDGTFATSTGVPGITVCAYSGHFWQTSNVIAMRGTGVQGGLHVQFILFQITESPQTILTLTEIRDEYVEEIAGVKEINALNSSDVRSVLRRVRGLSIPESGLGRAEVYEKIPGQQAGPTAAQG